MAYKKIIPYINAENDIPAKVIQLAENYSYGGADELFLYNYSRDEKSREEFLSLARQVSREIDIPFMIGCYTARLEDVKKALYTGASAAVIKTAILKDFKLFREASDRFGSEKIIAEIDMNEIEMNEIDGNKVGMNELGRNKIDSNKMGMNEIDADMPDKNEAHISGRMDHEGEALCRTLSRLGAGKILLKHITLSSHTIDRINSCPVPVIIRDSLVRNDIVSLISLDNVIGVSTNFFETRDIRKAKHALKEDHINVDVFESALPFSDFKTDANGLIPVIVQDYKSDEVLMLAYMNEEAYNRTVDGGRMTYYSRSRGKLWMKGETSGHYQYVKELTLDCDADTILAKVLQIGPACHTGHQSCFYTGLVSREYHTSDPVHVFQDVYNTITDRKKNPREGSYTNYLFDKGIDKILKKCGEESAEIIIAAKNPGSEELRYEIADYLYHMMVLMAECGLEWDDITAELANRK